MGKVVKILLGMGTFVLILGIILGNSGWSDIKENDKKISTYISEESNNITMEFKDEDGRGSIGWYIMIQGQYLDENKNGRTDACEYMEFNVTVTNSGKNVTATSSEFTCIIRDDFSDKWQDPVQDDDWIVVAYVCATMDTETGYDCTVGTQYTISSNISMKLYNADEKGLVDWNAFMMVMGGGGSACFGCCLFGISGLIAMTAKKPSRMTFAPGSAGALGASALQNQIQAQVNQNQTHLSQPVLEQQHESYEPPAQSGMKPPSGGL